MASRGLFPQALEKLGDSMGEYVRRRRAARKPPAPPPPPPPPMDTMSSPGQIADAQQQYGAEMAPRSARGADDG